MATLLRQKVLGPLGLTNTVASADGRDPEPGVARLQLRAPAALGISPGTPFYEESTYWNPDWGDACGRNGDDEHLRHDQDRAGGGQRPAAVEVELPSPDRPEPARVRARAGGLPCIKQMDIYNYGLGIVRSGSWLLENPHATRGYAATEAYLPSKKIAIAVADTFGPKAFDAQGDYVERQRSDLPCDRRLPGPGQSSAGGKVTGPVLARSAESCQLRTPPAHVNPSPSPASTDTGRRN